MCVFVSYPLYIVSFDWYIILVGNENYKKDDIVSFSNVGTKVTKISYVYQTVNLYHTQQMTIDDIFHYDQEIGLGLFCVKNI